MRNSDKKKRAVTCSKCPGDTCHPLARADEPLPSIDRAPPYCPMRRYPQIMARVRSEYQRSDIREFARLASVQEFECYEHTPDGLKTRFPRIEEIIQFCQKCNYQKIGFAFCSGLREEMRMVSDIFVAKGFEVISVNCKVGQVPKEYIGIKDEEKIIGPGMVETMCNPIAQAEVLNAEQIDLAVMLGLCVGHDSLFLQNISPPCTVLAVKDRVMGHNPLAAVYLSRSPYYGRLRAAEDKTGKGEKVILK